MADADIDGDGDIDFQGNFVLSDPSQAPYSAASATLANVTNAKFLAKALAAGIADLTAVSAEVGDYDRLVLARLQEAPSVFDWSGASFDVRLQKALDATTGDLYCPPNDPTTGQPHVLLNAVVGHRPTRLRCAPIWGDVAALTGGNAGSAITGGAILWGGAAGGHAITFVPSTTGNIIIGAGIEGFVFDGQNAAAEMVHANNCQYFRFVGKIRRCTSQGARDSALAGSTSNYSLKNDWQLQYDCGASAACYGSDGLVTQGGASAGIATTQHTWEIFGATKNGYALRVLDADNCHGSVQGYRYPGGTGGAIYHSASGASGFASRNNEFEYVNGVIVEEAGCFANHVKHYAAEAGGITSANVWHGQLFDPVLKREFKTPSYKLRDKISISPEMCGLFGSSVRDTFGVGGFWGGFKLPDAVNNAGASIIIPAPIEWDDGFIYQIKVRLTTLTGSAPAAANAAMQVSLCCKDPNGSTGWGTAVNQTAVIACAIPATQSMSSLFTFDLDALTPTAGTFPVAFTRGNDLAININRLANNAADTYSDYVWFAGATVYYRGKGPRGTGIGTIDIPPFA